MPVRCSRTKAVYQSISLGQLTCVRVTCRIALNGAMRTLNMSEVAFQTYEQALKQQHSRNEARRIRMRVSEARRNPYPASLRWPFELLQNALDVGPRQGNVSVGIRVCLEPSGLVFEH